MKLENYEQHPERVWVCEECGCAFADEELRRAVANSGGYHPCKDDPDKFCESFLMPYMPEGDDPSRMSEATKGITRAAQTIIERAKDREAGEKP